MYIGFGIFFVLLYLTKNINKMTKLEKTLIGFDYNTQKQIRELYKLDKTQLALYIINLENSILKLKTKTK